MPEYHSRNFLVRRLFLKRLELAMELAGIKDAKGVSVLDIGCGEGLFLKMLRERYPSIEIAGMDIHPGVASLELPGVTVRRADISNESLPPESYDCIFCLDVLEHIRDLSAPIAAVKGALKKNGRLVVSAPAENAFHKIGRFLLKGTFSEKTGPAAGAHHHNARGIREIMEKSGFELKGQKALPLPGPFHVMKLFIFTRKT